MIREVDWPGEDLVGEDHEVAEVVVWERSAFVQRIVPPPSTPAGGINAPLSRTKEEG